MSANLILIIDDKIYFPNRYLRHNGSLVKFSPTNFITNLGILFPLDFSSFALVEYLVSGIDGIKTKDFILKGVLLTHEKTIVEITVQISGDGTVYETVTPMAYSPDMKYSRGSDQIVDIVGSVGLEENYDGVDILIAAAKVSQLNRHHYNIMPISKYFDMAVTINRLQKQAENQ